MSDAMTSTSAEGKRAKFSRDVWWNVGGLAVAGGLGILLNYLVSAIYGAAALGVFNQVYAAYIVFSQFAALGFHYSVLRHVAAAPDQHERRVVVTSALIATAAIATLFAAALWLLAGPTGDVLGSPEVSRGIRYVAPGILFFALSKVTLGCLNALRRMRWYAILFGGRLVLMVIAFAGCAAFGLSYAVLPVILTLAEAATLLLSLIPVAAELGRVSRADLRRWVPEHLRFGIKGFMSGMLTVLNTRVDILVLGYFSSDTVVGAYSFAAILAEGLSQVLIVLRTNYAPVVIRLWSDRRTPELLATIRRGRNRTYLASIAAGALSVAGYALFVRFATSDPELGASWSYFAVLVAGLVASAGYSPFQPMLLYAGLPGSYTLLMLAIVCLNVLANAALIPTLGALGAALATATTLVIGVALLRTLVRRLLNLRI